MTLKFRSKTAQGWTTDAPFQAFTFPGGEPHIKVTDQDTGNYRYQLADMRGADSHDLITLAMWADLVRGRGETSVLILPYLPGARADRGAPFGAEVYAYLINSMMIDQIITLDPHSLVMPDYMHGLTVFPFQRIIKRELGNRGDYYDHPYVGVIAPDKGAVRRATVAANVLGVPVFKAEKTRDFDSGKLTGFTCEELPKTGKLLLVDDICDGGGTFNGLADMLRETQDVWQVRLDLWVTHGIFSKGVNSLTYNFAHIYTTDSFPNDIQHPQVTMFPVLPYLTGEINV